jgi:hypothetical protein
MQLNKVPKKFGLNVDHNVRQPLNMELKTIMLDIPYAIKINKKSFIVYKFVFVIFVE